MPPKLGITFFKPDGTEETCTATLQVSDAQIKIVYDGCTHAYLRSCFQPYQKPTEHGLMLVFKKGSTKAIRVEGEKKILKEIYKNLIYTVKKQKKSLQSDIRMPNSQEVKDWLDSIICLPEYPQILSHKSLLFYFIYLGASKGKPYNLTKATREKLLDRCQDEVAKYFNSPCGNDQRRLINYITKNIKMEDQAAEKQDEDRRTAPRQQKRGMKFPAHYVPRENPADIVLSDVHANGDGFDEAERATQGIQDDDDYYEDTDLDQTDLNGSLDFLRGITETQLYHDAIAQDSNASLQGPTPAMALRPRPQPRLAPRKKISMCEDLSKDHLNLSESSSSDEDSDDEAGRDLRLSSTRQRTLSSSSSDEGDFIVTKQTAKRQAPLPPLPGQPIIKRHKSAKNPGSDIIAGAEPIQETARRADDTLIHNVNTPSTASPDDVQQAVDHRGTEAFDAGEFVDHHEDATFEQEPNPTAVLPEEATAGDHGSGGNENGADDVGTKLVALLECPFSGTVPNYRHLQEKIEVALDNSFYMLLSLPNRDSVAMEVGRLLKEGFEPYLDHMGINGYPESGGFGPILIQHFNLYDEYFEPCELPKVCLAGCLKDDEAEALPGATEIEDHVKKPSHLARIRRKLVFEPKFIEEKAKLFKKTQQKLLDAYDIMKKDITFPVAPGYVPVLIERLQLSIFPILQVIDLLPKKPAPVNTSQYIAPMTYFCSACKDSFVSMEMHVLTVKHIANTNFIDLEAEQDHIIPPPPKEKDPPAVKKEEPVDQGYNNCLNPPVIDLTAEDEDLTTEESGITEPEQSLNTTN